MKLTADAKSLIAQALEKELHVSHLYRQFSNAMQRVGYFGAQKWFAKESADELEHFQIWTDYVNDRGDLIDVPAVEKMTERPTTLKEVLETAYKHESELGDFYEEMYEKLEDGGDCATAVRVQKFIKIQTQSIGEYGDWLSLLERCGDDPSALLILDGKLGG